MMLTVPEAARLFSVPEETVERWVRDGSIPFARVHDQIRFNRTELLEWASARGLRVAPELAVDAGGPAPSLAGALEAGGVHHGVPAANVAEALREAAARMPLGPGVDREELLGFLLARESLGSTGVGDGIAIPHASRPLVLTAERPSATLCYLATPVDYGAPDGRPVSTVFAFLTPTVRTHLQLLSRLLAALHDPGFRAAVKRGAGLDEILAEARRIEATPAGVGS